MLIPRRTATPRQAGHLQHRRRLAAHGRRVHRRARQSWHRYQHGRPRRLARQRVRRAVVAQRQIRGGLSAPPTLCPMSAPRSADTSIVTMAGVPTRALMAAPGSSLHQPAAIPRGSPTPAEAPLIDIAVQTPGATSEERRPRELQWFGPPQGLLAGRPRLSDVSPLYCADHRLGCGPNQLRSSRNVCPAQSRHPSPTLASSA